MINSIRLQNFRSYDDESFEFEPGVNIIVGPNGSGKTNLLEAILTTATGSSYRARDEDLIHFDKDWARLDVSTAGHQRATKLIKSKGRVLKNYVFDDKPYKLLTHQHTMPVVLFEPDHLLLLTGQPEARRLYLDTLLEQTVLGFAATRKRYRRALSQRNALLKSLKKPHKDQFFVWNLRLSELGGLIARARADLVMDMQKTFPGLYNEIAKASTKTFIYYSSKLPTDGYETKLLKALEQSHESDIARGFTSYGPHRDDFIVSFDGRPASEVASRGEIRTALLAIKIYELGLLEKVRGEKPLLLLDDVFSELDGKRRHSLASFLQTHQTFITTTDADLVISKLIKDCTVIALG